MSDGSYTEDYVNSEDYYDEEGDDDEDYYIVEVSGDSQSDLYLESSESTDDIYFFQLKSQDNVNEDGSICMPKHLCTSSKDKTDMVLYEKPKKESSKKVILDKTNNQKKVCSVTNKRVNTAAKTIGNIWKK